MSLQNIMPSERSQLQKTIYRVIPSIRNVRDLQTERRLVFAKGRELGGGDQK